jgi:hypothetical protein
VPEKGGTPVGKVSLVKGLPNLLLRRPADRPQWQNAAPGSGTVGPNDSLVALPGYRSEVRFNNNVSLLLWGSLPDVIPLPLLESGVTLRPAKDADLEFTLERGRVLVTNQKPDGAVKVRVHFNESKTQPGEAWELTLQDPGTEIALDLVARYPSGVAFAEGGDPPLASLYLVVLSGSAQVKADASTYSLRASPGLCLMSWENYGKGVHEPGQINPAALVNWDKGFPQTESAQRARDALDGLLRRWSAKPAEVILEESLQSDQPLSRVLGVLSLGALEAIPKVLDALADEDEGRRELRDAAVMALRQWIGWRADHDRKLYDILKDEKHYTPSQAETFMQLLHGFTEEQLLQPATYETLIGFLQSDKPTIRTLAFYHLFRLVPQGREPKYNPIGDTKQRDVAYQAWKKLLAEGQLPPKPQGQPQPPPKK